MVNDESAGAERTTNCQTRRATVDDLAALRQLWQPLGWPIAALEKRLGDFQVIETPDGHLLGAIGLQVEQQHGRLHAEVFASADLAELLRPRLWERVKTVARNHGLVRLWIENGSSLFWLEKGFETANSDLMKKLPDAFDGTSGRNWLSLQLRDEAASAVSVEKELELFRQTQKADGDRLRQQARAMQVIAGLVAVALFGLVGWALWYVWVRLPRGPRR
jgi:N-acetylglutamate synthase-like GNAT family acetyltransferase